MSFLSFVGYQLRWQLLRKRWLLPIPLLTFLAYRGINYLTAAGTLPSMTSPVNAWDLLLVTFGNNFNVYFVFGLLFLYLVSDLLPETNLGQLVLFRLKSRTAWWLGKTLTLLVLTLVFVLGSAGLLAGLASLALPWEAGYSEQATLRPDSVNLPAGYYTAGPLVPPFVFLFQELVLLALGLFAFGLLMLVVNQVTGRYYYGLLAGGLVLFGSYQGISLSGPPSWAKWLPGYHLTYMTFIPMRTIPLWHSFVYWGVWILLFWLVGFFISRRQDYSSGQA
ncbi:MAG: hypothetical protein H0S79_10440 [Anaerolineaceae bacterium]|nr:hypothetical protein [Anaerolineaceae bacterium]